jgi:tetratricopeptide (TPR) repeat protein
MHLGALEEAESTFAHLATQSPKEVVWWLRLGDCRRQGGRTDAALEAYRKAADLAGVRGELAVRLGLTLAERGDLRRAREALDAALGPSPGPEQLGALVQILEHEGITELAWGYRREALGRQLESVFHSVEEASRVDEEDDEIVH